MSEQWKLHACDVKISNLSQVDEYKALIPLLIKEMETQSRVPNPFFGGDYDDYSSDSSCQEDVVMINNSFLNKCENDNVHESEMDKCSFKVTQGSFEEVLNSIKCSPSKKPVKNTDPDYERDTGQTSNIVLEEIVLNSDSDNESDIVNEKVSESVENIDKASSCSPSDIMEITPDLIFDNSDTDDTETKDEFTCPREPTPEKRWDDDEIRETKWELNPETDKYVEAGFNLKGIKLKKMAVLVKEEHDFNKYLELGPVKTRVKLRNVRKQLGLINKPMFESIIVESRSESTHPYICPFFCPIYNVPCEAMFKANEQKYFIEHVTKGNCPYAARNDPMAPIEPMVRCEKCSVEIPESTLKAHMDDNHHTHTCPGCREKFECKVDVEDHIINEHATHFMSNLTKIYRRARKEQRTMAKTVQDDYVEASQPDPHSPPQPYIGHTLDGRFIPVAPPLSTPSNIMKAPHQPQMMHQLVAPQPKYPIPSTGGVRLVYHQPTPLVRNPMPNTYGSKLIQQQSSPLLHNAITSRPRLVFLPQQGSLPASSNVVLVNNGQVRSTGANFRHITPTPTLASTAHVPMTVGNQASNTSTAPMILGSNAGNHVQSVHGQNPHVLGSKARLQQLKLPTGELVWAQPTASEPIPGTDKAKIQFKVVGPVKPLQSTQGSGVIRSMANPHAPTVSNYVGPIRVETPSNPIQYRHIVPSTAQTRGHVPKNLIPVKPMRMAQPLRLLHVDKDGAPVYQHNGLQPGKGQVDSDGAPVKQNNNHTSNMWNSGFGSDVTMLNSVKLVPYNKILKRHGDHEYSAAVPTSEEEGVDPLEGLDPYNDQDPLADTNDTNPPVVFLDDCPDVPVGDDDSIDISSLCQTSVEGWGKLA